MPSAPDPPPTIAFRPPTCPKPRILKLRGDQERRRFFVGVAVAPQWEHVVASLVAASGRGLETRLELASHVLQPLPGDLASEQPSFAQSGARSATTSRLVARITETAALALEWLGAREHEVWPVVFLCGVAADDCIDAALLAEMSQLNVVDGFAARDAVLNGTGQHLDALPLWLLFRHARRQRLLVQADDVPRLLLLPASRDERGTDHIIAHQATDMADLRQRIGQQGKRSPGPDDLLWLAAEPAEPKLLAELRNPHSTVTLYTPDALGVAIEALPAASAATLAMLHIDQTPANLPYLTGASAPRVLGRLTPGSAKSWNRLLRDLAFSRPLVTPLRAVVQGPG